MKTAWINLAGKNKEKEQDIKAALADGKNALEYLTEILEKRLEASRNNQIARKGYDETNWAYKQADFVGEQRAYEEIIELIKTK